MPRRMRMTWPFAAYLMAGIERQAVRLQYPIRGYFDCNIDTLAAVEKNPVHLARFGEKSAVSAD